MQNPSRRSAIATGLGAISCALLSPASAAEPGLDALARTKGLRFGSQVGLRQLADPRYVALVLAECGVIVPGNALKWPNTEPSPGRFNFADADRILSFATKHQLLVRGHNLLFMRPRTLPKWLSAEAGHRDRLEQLLSDHIATECQRYPQIRSWDVVNEAIDPKTGALRADILTAAMGEKVIDFAFEAASRQAPRAQLVYNDYMDWRSSAQKHRAGVLRLLADLRKRNVPIGALGLQSHLGPRWRDPPTESITQMEKNWRTFLDEVVAMGFTLLITELDIRDVRFQGNPQARDRIEADYVRAYLDVTLSYPAVKQILTWGLVDKYSWQRKVAPRRDGQPNRPLPYDDDYRPKPLREAIAAAIRAAPVRA